MMALAVRVALWLPGWRVRGATLAAPDALEVALARMTAPLIYPFFMAEGWFTRTTLRKRLAAHGAAHLTQLAAFGHDPGLPDLIARTALAACLAQRMECAGATLILAAHGSQVSRASATITERIARVVRATTPFARVVTGYVEEPPYLAKVARLTGPALCLPLFATRAGHVATDVPEALAKAGFAGILLPAIGEHAATAQLIAAALWDTRSAGAAAVAAPTAGTPGQSEAVTGRGAVR